MRTASCQRRLFWNQAVRKISFANMCKFTMSSANKNILTRIFRFQWYVQPATLLKLILLQGCLSRFLNCTKWYQIAQRTTNFKIWRWVKERTQNLNLTHTIKLRETFSKKYNVFLKSNTMKYLTSFFVIFMKVQSAWLRFWVIQFVNLEILRWGIEQSFTSSLQDMLAYCLVRWPFPGIVSHEVHSSTWIGVKGLWFQKRI